MAEHTQTHNRQYTLSEEFMRDYEKLVEKVDEAGKNHFNGEKLNKLVQDFFAKHNDYMRGFPFSVSWSKFPDCGYYETVAEDKRIIDSDIDSNSSANIGSEIAVPEYAKILGQVYWRACGSLYFYITLLKSRDNVNLDRHEVVQLCRYAIRYDPNSPTILRWFMITVGYQVEGSTNSRERSILGNLFLHSALRCQRADPGDALAYSLHGRYLHSVASLNWLERKVASGLSGERVFATFEEAEKAFLKAHSLKSDWMPTGLWMARCLLNQKRPLEEVKKWIDLSLSLEVVEPTSVVERQECLELRARLKLQ